MSLTYMLNPKCLNLVVSQAQDNMSRQRRLDTHARSKVEWIWHACLNLAVSYVQDNDYPSLTCLGELPTFLGSNLREELGLYKLS